MTSPLTENPAQALRIQGTVKMQKGDIVVAEGKNWKVLGTVGELYPEMFGAARPPRVYSLDDPIYLPPVEQSNSYTAS